MPETRTDSELRAILALTEEEASAIGTGNLERYLSILVDDAVFMPPNSPEKAGPELRNWLAGFLESVTVEYHSFAHGDALVAGDMAYHVFSCSWTAHPRSPAQAARLYFKGLHILQRQADGHWKIAREIWNLSPAP